MSAFLTLYAFNYKKFLQAKMIWFTTVLLLVGTAVGLYLLTGSAETTTVDVYVRNNAQVDESVWRELVNKGTEQDTVYEFKQVANEEDKYPQAIVNEASGVYTIEFIYQDSRDIDQAMEERVVGGLKAVVGQQQENVLRSRKALSTDGATRFIIGYVGMMIVFVLISMFGSSVLQSIVTEKLNKIMDIMAYKTSPIILIYSKIFALLTVMTQLILLVILEVFILGWTGLISIDFLGDMLNTFNIDYFNGGMMILFIILGTFVYMLFYAISGVFVESEEQSQTVVVPVIVTVMVMMWIAMYAIMNPDGPVLAYSIYVPLVSPMTLPTVILSGQYEYWQLLVVALTFIGFLGGVGLLVNKVILPRKLN